MHSSTDNTCRGITIFGQTVCIGLFRSTPVEVRVQGDIASTTNRLLTQVEGVSILGDSSEPGTGAKRTFRVRTSVGGMRFRFNWHFFGELTSEGTVVVVRGVFQLSRLLTIYYAIWFAFAGLFTAASTVIAAISDTPEIWLLPITALIIVAGGFSMLRIGRTLSEPAIQRVALQLDSCFGTTLRI